MASCGDKFDDWDPMNDAYSQRNPINPRSLSGKVAMGKKDGGSVSLVVVGLSPTVNEAGLRNLFGKVGAVTNVSLYPKNPKFDTLKAMVTMKSSLDAEKAIERFDGQNIFGHRMKVIVAQPFDDRRGPKWEGSGAPSWSYSRPPGTHRPSSPPGSVDGRSDSSLTPVGMGRGRRTGEAKPRSSMTAEDRGVFRQPAPPRASLPGHLASRASDSASLASSGLRKPYLLETPPKPLLEIGKVAQVYVHAESFVSPMSFPCATHNPLKLNIDARYRTRKPNKLHRFSPDELVAAPFEDMFYRARIVSRQENDNFLVSFIDFGNEAVVSRNQLIALDEEDVTTPPMFLKLSLEGVTEANTDEYTNELSKIVANSPDGTITGRILRFDKGHDAYVMEFPLGGSPRQAEKSKPSFAPAPAAPDLQPGQRVRLFVDLDTSDISQLILKAQAADPKQLITVIERYATPTGLKALTADVKPPIGAMLAAPYLGEHYRALVKGHVGPGKVKVFFVDFGNTDEISLSNGDVYPLEQRFVDFCPALYLELKLAGVDEGNKSMFVRKLQNLVTSENQLPVDGIVESFDAETKVCVFDIGLRFAASPPKKPQGRGLKAEAVSPVSSHLAGFVRKETTCAVKEAPAANCLVVIPEDKEPELAEFSLKVASYGQKAPPLTQPVHREQFVLAPFENDFYRAVVNDVDESKGEASLFFVDYGNLGVVPIDQLRRFGPDGQTLATKPPFAIPCRVAGVRPPNRAADFSQAALEKVVMLVGQPPVFVRGLGVAPDATYGQVLLANFSKQSLPCLAAALVAEGLADEHNEVLPPAAASLPSSASADASAVSPRAGAGAISSLRAGAGAISPPRANAASDEEVPNPLLEDLTNCRFSKVTDEWVSGMLSLTNTAPDFFTLVHQSDLVALEEMTAIITEKIMKKPPAPIEMKDLAAGRMVIAKFAEGGQEAYYRGCVSRISRRHRLAQVLFIDFGNVAEVDLEFVYPIDPEFLTQPIIPMYCCLSGLKVTSKFPEDIKITMDNVMQATSSPPPIRVRVVELMVPETPSTPVMAVIEAELGGQGLLNQLRTASSPSNAARPSRSPVVEAAPMSNGRSSPVTVGVIEKSRTVIVKDEPTVKGASGVHSKDLEKRVSRLELELSECHKKIYELETMLFGMINAGRTDKNF